MQVQVIENVLKLNDEIAAMNRQILKKAGVFTVDLIGAPGCGKTALVEATLQRLSPLFPSPGTPGEGQGAGLGKALAPQSRCAVIVGDMATQRDADRMARYCDQVIQINTGKGCHLEAHHIHQALARLNLDGVKILFIENVGNLICPVGFDLGQDAKIGIFSVSGGDDKIAKHPHIICQADVLVLTKTDLLAHIPFDIKLFKDDIASLNPKVKLLELSAVTGQGMDQWTNWLLERA